MSETLPIAGANPNTAPASGTTPALPNAGGGFGATSTAQANQQASLLIAALIAALLAVMSALGALSFERKQR